MKKRRRKKKRRKYNKAEYEEGKCEEKDKRRQKTRMKKEKRITTPTRICLTKKRKRERQGERKGIRGVRECQFLKKPVMRWP